MESEFHAMHDDRANAPSPAFSALQASPLNREMLGALLDLGLSNAEVARYFGIEPRHVVLLRTAYGM